MREQRFSLRKRRDPDLQVFVIFWQGSVLGFLVILFNLLLPLGIHLDFGRKQSRHSYKFEVRVTNQFSGQPEEGLLEVVIGLGRDVIILKVLLTVENNGFS